jgi:hypothetical protein
MRCLLEPEMIDTVTCVMGTFADAAIAARYLKARSTPRRPETLPYQTLLICNRSRQHACTPQETERDDCVTLRHWWPEAALTAPVVRTC